RILVGASGRRGAITIVVLQTRTRDQLRDRETARAAHGLFATVDMCFERRAVQRLGAVEAVVYSCVRWNAGRASCPHPWWVVYTCVRWNAGCPSCPHPWPLPRVAGEG